MASVAMAQGLPLRACSRLTRCPGALEPRTLILGRQQARRQALCCARRRDDDSDAPGPSQGAVEPVAPFARAVLNPGLGLSALAACALLALDPGAAAAYADPLLNDGAHTTNWLQILVELTLVYLITTTVMRVFFLAWHKLKGPQQGTGNQQQQQPPQQQQRQRPPQRDQKQQQQQHQQQHHDEDDDESKWSTARIRSYTDLNRDAGSGRGSQQQQDLRNRALSTAATFHIATAIKECKPRIHQLLQELSAFSKPAPSAPSGGSGGGGGALACAIPRPKAADMDPVAELVWQTLMRMCNEGRPWSAMSAREHEQLELQLAEMVAEQAALREIELLLKVVHEEADKEEALPDVDQGAMWP